MRYTRAVRKVLYICAIRGLSVKFLDCYDSLPTFGNVLYICAIRRLSVKFLDYTSSQTFYTLGEVDDQFCLKKLKSFVISR